jgi:hypothetical protein
MANAASAKAANTTTVIIPSTDIPPIVLANFSISDMKLPPQKFNVPIVFDRGAFF